MRLNNWRKKILNFLPSESEKILIFINMRENLGRVALLLKKIVSQRRHNFILVCFNSQVPVYLKDSNVDIRLSEDYLKDEDYQEIDKYIFNNLSRRWYSGDKEELKDITKFDNIHLGSLIEYEFQLFLVPRIKNLKIVKKAIDSVKPNRIIAIEDTSELCEVVDLVGKILHIPVLKFHFQYHNLIKNLRTRIIDAVEFLIDKFVRMMLLDDSYHKNIVGIDARLYSQLSHKNQIRCILAPFEKGVRIRLRILKNKNLYIPFYFPSTCEIKFQKLFAERWNRLKVNLNFRGIFRYEDLNIWELVEGRLRYFFLQSFPRISKNIRLLEKIANEKSIKLFVIRHDVRELEKTIVMTAKQLNLHTLVIQHGIMGEDNGHDIVYTDKMAVWGEAYVRKYVNLGNTREKFVVTGNPKYDALYNRNNRLSKEKICQILKLKPKKKIIILATQPIIKFSAYRTDDESEILLRKVLSAVKQFPEEQLIIKLHPYENDKMYKRVLSEFRLRNIVITTNLNIWDLINAADLLLTSTSTVALEAMIIGKPVIAVTLGKRKGSIPYGDRKAALGVYKAEFIASSIKQILENSLLRENLIINAQKFVNDYAYKIDGQASRRVSELIERSANKP